MRVRRPRHTPLDRLAEPAPVSRRTWDEDWVTVRCESCDREDQWPAPELGCSCGTALRIPVRGVRRPQRAQLAPGAVGEANHDTDEDTGAAAAPDTRPHPDIPDTRPQPSDVTSPEPRPAFQPVTIRTARDAVTAAALYLRWLGYRDIRRADQRPRRGSALPPAGSWPRWTPRSAPPRCATWSACG